MSRIAGAVENNSTEVRITQLPRPPVGVGEVLIRVETSGVNPLDTKIRAGTAAHARHDLPAILGSSG